jgi:tryptophan 6-halogenase
LDVPEKDWMPQCNATYKCGIRFPSWSTKAGYESYYHPFFSQHDDGSVRAFFQNSTLRSRNFNVYAHPDAFFISNFLAKNKFSPKPRPTTSYSTDYAYHFDASLMGSYLNILSQTQGVKRIVDTVYHVNQNDKGEITSVQTVNHDTLEADFFIDCTGFSGLLINKTLNVPFIPYADRLFNDSAIAMPTPLISGEGLPSETISKAMKHGWTWKIPLTNRFGNGYVYSSQFTDKNQAELELRTHLGIVDDNVEARHLQMRVGRTKVCWEKNCLAVGLSQGFIEPLEATALMAVQETIELFIETYSSSGDTEKARLTVNEKVNLIFDGIRNYVQMHYKLNTRNDTQYWIENRQNKNLSDDMQSILKMWDKGGDLLGTLKGQSSRLVYSPTSWYCILAGMGRFPSGPKKPKPKMQYYSVDEASSYCKNMMSHFEDHRETLGLQMP